MAKQAGTIMKQNRARSAWCMVAEAGDLLFGVDEGGLLVLSVKLVGLLGAG